MADTSQNGCHFRLGRRMTLYVQAPFGAKGRHSRSFAVSYPPAPSLRELFHVVGHKPKGHNRFMKPESMFMGENFIMLDKRDKQALLRGILEIEKALSPEELEQIQRRRHPLIQDVLRLEREYVRLDTVLMGVAQRMEDLAGNIRDLLGGNGFDKAKTALYKTILPPQDSNGPIQEEQFTEWQREFQRKFL